MINKHQSQPSAGLFGEGITLYDLADLLRVIRNKNLTLQVKIIDHPWENLSVAIITQMIGVITSGAINGSNDIRLRLFTK